MSSTKVMTFLVSIIAIQFLLIENVRSFTTSVTRRESMFNHMMRARTVRTLDHPSLSTMISPSTVHYRHTRQRHRRQQRNFFPLYESEGSGTGNNINSKSKVQFTGQWDGRNDGEMNENILDRILSFIASDVTSIVMGSIGLLWVVIHRLTLLDTEEAEQLTVQTRTDLLAVLACGSVLLNGVSKLDVTTALAESVQLDGTKLDNPVVEYMFSNPSDKEIENSKVISTVTWILTSLLDSSPADTAVLIQRKSDSSDDYVVSCKAGVLPETAIESPVLLPEKTPILDRVASPGNVKETYLPTLQALPGKREFTYLPSNAQLALLIPILVESGDSTTAQEDNSSNSVLVLASDTAKSFSPRDIAWCRVVAGRLSAVNR